MGEGAPVPSACPGHCERIGLARGTLPVALRCLGTACRVPGPQPGLMGTPAGRPPEGLVLLWLRPGWGTDWMEQTPPTAPRPSRFSLLTSAHSGFLSFYTHGIFEDVDSSGQAWPECPLRCARDEVCATGGCRWRPGHPLPSPAHPCPPLPPVSPLYLHPASFPLSWPFSLLHQGEHPLLRLLMSPVTAPWGRRPGAGAAGDCPAYPGLAQTARPGCTGRALLWGPAGRGHCSHRQRGHFVNLLWQFSGKWR